MTCSTACYATKVSEQISQRELRNDSGRIMRALADGKSFIVNSHGRPVGELRPLRRDRFVDISHVLGVFDGVPRLDYERLRNDLDALVAQEAPGLD